MGDKSRAFRFWIPPLIFMASLAVGAYFDKDVPLPSLYKTFASEKLRAQLIATIFAGGALVALGFLISAWSVFILMIIHPNAGANVSNRTLTRISEIIRIRLPKNEGTRQNGFQKFCKRICNHICKYSYSDCPAVGRLKSLDANMLEIVAIFHHGFMPPKLFKWVERRMDMFNLGWNCVTGIAFSFIVGYCFIGIDASASWNLIGIVTAIVLIINAENSRNEAMQIIYLLSKCELNWKIEKNSA